MESRPRPLLSFMADRLAYLLEQRGFDVRSVRAVLHAGVEDASPLEARRKLEALAQMTGSRGVAGRGGAAQAREEHLQGRGDPRGCRQARTAC